MNDAISRRELLNRTIYNPLHSPYITERDVLDCPQAQQWIPCSEHLPKVREWVLCQCRAGIMDVLRLTEDGNWNKNYPHAEYMGGFVIAWMPLPVSYQERGQDENE